jgi:hypothetical protein
VSTQLRTRTRGIEGGAREAPSPLGRRPGVAAAALALGVYLALAVALLGRTWLGSHLGRRLVGGGGDPLGLTWFLAWLPHALAHGQWPFFSTAVMAPQGANLLASTSISLPALLLWPVTAAAGPSVAYDLLATLAIALSAWVAYLALRRLCAHGSSALLGGAVYGFGGYTAGQATAHANLLVGVFPPLVALLADEVRRGRGAVKIGALLGLAAAAQVFVDEELLATTAVMAAIAAALVFAAARPTSAAARPYAIALGVATLAFLALAGPALGYQLLGPQHVSGAIVSPGRYVDDLTSFVVPSSLQLLGTAGARQLASGFSGYDGEWGGYLGAPLACVLVWAVWRLRRRALLPALLLLAALVLGLGPHLRVLGHDTGVPMPWVLPGHLPLLENVVPDRFNLFVWLAAAALLVLLVEDLRASAAPRRRAWGVAVCLLALVPALPALSPSRTVAVPPVLANARELQRLAPGARTVLVVPAGNGQLAMYAQAQAGFAYRIPDGGVFVPNPAGPSYGMREGPLLYALAALAGRPATRAGRTATDSLCLARIARLDERCRRHYLGALKALRVDTVVVCAPSSRSVTRETAFFTALLGRPVAGGGGLVFRVA